MPETILRLPEVTKAAGLSRTTIWRLERAVHFPKRRQLGPNSVGWLASEIENWATTRELADPVKTVQPACVAGGAR